MKISALHALPLAIALLLSPLAGQGAEKASKQSQLTKNSISFIAFSPDGRRAATAPDGSGTVDFWDTSTGKLLKVLEKSKSLKYSVVFSPDGKLLAAGVGALGILVWDAATLKLVKKLTAHGDKRVNCVAFSPDGRYLASAGSDKKVMIFRTSDWSLHRSIDYTMNDNRVGAVAFSPDSRQVLFGGQHNRSDIPVFVHDVESGEKVREIMVILFSEDIAGGWIEGIRFSPDGKSLIIESNSRVKVFSLPGSLKFQLANPMKYGFNHARFSPDGRYIAAGYAFRFIGIYDASSGRLLGYFEVEATVYNLEFTPDGSLLAVVGSEPRARQHHRIYYYDWKKMIR